MGLETGVNFIDDLVATNPLSGDDPSEGQNHLNIIKTAVQGSFTSLGSVAVTATAAELNVMDGVTSFLDEDNMASDSATSIASQQSIKAYVDNKLATTSVAIIDIGDWDMVTDTVVNVAHGLTYTKIRTVSVLIRNDADTAGLDFLSFESGQTTAQYLAINATNVQLTRSSTGIFNSANYNSTSYNRGWITITYAD